MKPSKNKFLLGAAILGLAVMAGSAMADDDVDITATIETDSGITAAVVDSIDFGSYLIGVDALSGDQVTITIDTLGALTSNATGTAQVIDLTGTATGTPGQATVDLPSGADGIELQMTRDVITQFVDTNITLDDITYRTATEAEDPVLEATPVIVTVVAGGTPEPVFFGGTITADATPADNAAHTATFNVNFGY